MMNKSKIDWCDFTWNPVTGCNKGCPYCYARKQAQRFCGDVRLNKASPQIKNGGAPGIYELEKPFKNERGTTTPFPTGFEPTLHRYRLNMPEKKKKPAVIFVCSMGDLFSPDIPMSWVNEIMGACRKAPQHTYLFLTKYPRTYMHLAELGVLPNDKNFWYGTSATMAESEFFADTNYNTFVSIEPIKERFPRKNEAEKAQMKWGLQFVDWVIIGAETGYQIGKTIPEREWIEDIVTDLREIGKPIFMKDSRELKAIWGESLIKEFPKGIQLMQTENIPHCKECERCTAAEQGERGIAYYCDMNDDGPARHIPGRYTRTSPSWCPKRGG